MEYKRNLYLFLIFDFLTNLSPLSFIYALFLKQQNMSLTQIGFIISAYQISKLIFEIPSGVFWVTNFNWGHYFWGLIWGQF